MDRKEEQETGVNGPRRRDYRARDWERSEWFRRWLELIRIGKAKRAVC